MGSPIPGGVPVGGFFVPSSDTDTYPVTDSQYELGGWHEVANLNARDLITPQRRRKGMAAFQQDTKQIWILQNGVENTDWVELVITPTNSAQQTITFVMRGNLIASTPIVGNAVLATGTGTVLGATIMVSTPPTGSAATFSLKKNTVAFGTISVAAGASTGTVTISSPVSVTAGDSFTLAINTVGSTTPGGWAIVTLSLRYS